VRSADPFTKIASAPCALAALDANGGLWVLAEGHDGAVRWYRQTLPERVDRFVDLSLHATESTLTLIGLASGGVLYRRLLPRVSWGAPPGWTPWTVLPTDREIDTTIG
jgi:hypothetical protein